MGSGRWGCGQQVSGRWGLVGGGVVSKLVGGMYSSSSSSAYMCMHGCMCIHVCACVCYDLMGSEEHINSDKTMDVILYAILSPL